MDNLFYWLSKLIWLFISPDSLLLIWLGFGLLLLRIGYLSWAKRLLFSLFISFLLIGLFPIGDWLIYPLESRYPVNPQLHNVDGIVALSGALDPVGTTQWDQVIVGDAAERNFTFMMLAKRYPAARLVYTGGASSMMLQEYKAADVAERLFTEQGMDLTRITFERESSVDSRGFI